jgi:hypothetical protein
MEDMGIVIGYWHVACRMIQFLKENTWENENSAKHALPAKEDYSPSLQYVGTK